MRRLDSVFRDVRSFQAVDVDFPNVVSNGSVSVDIPTTESFPLGTHLISWGFQTDASDIDDMQITMYFTDVDTLRVTLTNPTGGAINPGVITVNFVTGLFNEDLIETI